MAEEGKELLPGTTPSEIALDIVAAVVSIAPWVGGPVSSLVSGVSSARKLGRIREVLVDMANQIKDLQSTAAETYVKLDEFEELLEKTLRQAAEERNVEKRAAYAAFLANDIASPGKPYDEKIRILRTIDQLQADHIRLMKALLQEPDLAVLRGQSSGSVLGTLAMRLPGMPRDRIADLARQLTDMRLADLSNLNTMITARGAQELRGTVTPYGMEVIKYITGRS